MRVPKIRTHTDMDVELCHTYICVYTHLFCAAIIYTCHMYGYVCMGVYVCSICKRTHLGGLYLGILKNCVSWVHCLGALEARAEEL